VAHAAPDAVGLADNTSNRLRRVGPVTEKKIFCRFEARGGHYAKKKEQENGTPWRFCSRDTFNRVDN
jgi:hypothetical protein